MNSIQDLQTLIKTDFKDKEKLHQALIHRSFLNENKESGLTSNERYEFLGDAVLELWASKTLFSQFPEYPEGDLTNLRSLVVRTENLAKIALEIQLGEYVLLSHGEETHGGRHNQSILADTFESLIGAIYLDRGFTAAAEFLDRFVLQNLKDISNQKIYKDPKSLFQEIAQAKEGVTPHYDTISESGPDHQKTFEIGVYLGDRLIATGTGNSKQRAEEAAAISGAKILDQIK